MGQRAVQREGDPLTAIVVTLPSNVTLTTADNPETPAVEPEIPLAVGDSFDGYFVYTPDAGFSGTDTFTYKAGDGQAESSPATVTIDVGQAMPLALNLPVKDAPALGDSGLQDVAGITTREIRALARDAVRRWALVGVDTNTLRQAVSGLEFHVQDLPCSKLAVAAAGHITVDINAAGCGWFVDPSPADGREFQKIVAETELQAVGKSSAVGFVDLLTVLTHEIGHLLRLPDLPQEIFPHHIMSELIGLVTRRTTDQIPHRDDPYVPEQNDRDVFSRHLGNGFHDINHDQLDEAFLEWARSTAADEPDDEQPWEALLVDLARSIVQRDNLAQSA